jgi:glycosyltransferase involved in cell wall biosynthesis
MNQPGPRYLKGLPTKIFEYMIMGLPVVSATGPLLKTLINKYNIGLTVDSTNIDSIAKGIEKMAQRKNLKEMGKRGNKIVKESYCWEAKEDKLLRIIEKLTN